MELYLFPGTFEEEDFLSTFYAESDAKNFFDELESYKMSVLEKIDSFRNKNSILVLLNDNSFNPGTWGFKKVLSLNYFEALLGDFEMGDDSSSAYFFNSLEKNLNPENSPDNFLLAGNGLELVSNSLPSFLSSYFTRDVSVVRDFEDALSALSLRIKSSSKSRF